MEYKKIRDDYVIRFDKGEEILERLAKFAQIEQVGTAQVSAIGASNDFRIGVLNTSTKEYTTMDCSGDYEIISLNGNITSKDDKPYLHLHGSFSNADRQVVAGHILKLVVSVTCEMFVRVFDGIVTREMSESVGVNTLKFN